MLYIWGGQMIPIRKQTINNKQKRAAQWVARFWVWPACVSSNGCKSLTGSGSGNRPAREKGCPPRGGIWKKSAAKIWPNVQILDIRLFVRMSWPKASKSDNYPESPMVNQVGIRWKDDILNWWGLTDVVISCFYEKHGAKLAVRGQQPP